MLTGVPLRRLGLPSRWSSVGEDFAATVSRRLGLNTQAQARAEPDHKVTAGSAHGGAHGAASHVRSSADRLASAFFLLGLGSFVVLRLELAQLVPLAAVALWYTLRHCRRRRTTHRKTGAAERRSQAGRSGEPRSAAPAAASAGAHGAPGASHASHQPCARPRHEVRHESRVPVTLPTFQAREFEPQVVELLATITPTAESEQVAHRLAECAQRAIRQIFPEVEVAGFVSGDIVQGTAFGVAVPELELVASANPHSLFQQLQGRLTKGGQSAARIDARKLQKSAIRVCTDQLVSSGGFKFRRSAFRGQEPKVTLMAPPALGSSEKNIPIDFSVNSVSPVYNAALLQECQSIESRARGLVLLVRRWAKDRGICHAAKGHLPPYAWTLLAVYFLQVGLDGCPLLPPLQGFKMVNRMTVRRGGGEIDERKGRKRWMPPSPDAPEARMSIASLFTAFVRFYHEEIDWQREAVSVRLGQRKSANLHLMVHMVVNEEKSAEVGLSIEDPFEPARNLGTSVTSTGMQRFKEELARADALLRRNGLLSELIEPWAPAERDGDEENDGFGDDAPGVQACAREAFPSIHRRRRDAQDSSTSGG